MIMSGNKKRKIGGVAINDDARTAIMLDRPNTGRGVTKSSYHRDDQTMVRSESKELKRRNGISMKLLTDLFAPRFSFTRLGYGNDLTRRDYRAWEMTQEKAGTARMCFANNGYQWWGEFLALPMSNPGIFKTASNQTPTAMCVDNFHTSVDQLINKANDVRNETAASYINSYVGLSTMDLNNVGGRLDTSSVKMKQLYNNNFAYEGGYQEHTFENVGGSPVVIEVWECIPREPMPLGTMAPETAFGGSASATDANIYPNTIKRQLLKSYKMNLPIGNGQTPAYVASVVGGNTLPNNESTDEIEDPMVRINKDSTFVHTHWYVKKPIKTTLQPGDRYTHKMHLKAFELNSTAMNSLSTQVEFLTSTNNEYVRELPCYIPQFTKVLAVRIVGTTNWSGNTAFGTARTQAKINYDAGVTNNNSFFGGAVNIGTCEVRVIHQCVEHHACRMLPEQFSDSHFVDDRRDRSNGQTFDINPMTNVEANDSTGAGGSAGNTFA